MQNNDCCGCGYCCMKVRCALGTSIHGAGDNCPSLVWQHDRWRCAEVLKDTRLREPLAIGAGCSSSLFNTQREAMLAYHQSKGG